MKKLTLIAAAALLAAVSSQAQGLVNFNNSSSAGSQISTNTVVGSAATGKTVNTAGAFYYALFTSTTATTVNGSTSALIPTGSVTGSFGVLSDAAWTAQGTLAQSAASFGRISGPTSLALSGVGLGGSFRAVVLGWSANFGTDLATLITTLNAGNTVGFLGQSAVSGVLVAGDGGSIPAPVIMAAASPAVIGFTLGLNSVAPVPEPSTMALAALGGASLLLFRRRK